MIYEIEERDGWFEVAMTRVRPDGQIGHDYAMFTSAEDRALFLRAAKNRRENALSEEITR